MRPDISVVIPAHNEAARLVDSIRSMARARVAGARLEVVVADDASVDGTGDTLYDAWPDLSREGELEVLFSHLEERQGVARARNHAASLASADIVFVTDAHVRFSEGWDELVFRHVRADRIVAGVVTKSGTSFAGYGCSLIVPAMGTRWNRQRVTQPRRVQIAPCPATALRRDLFERLGGYDGGMLRYGSAEPEFSVRAWLHGAEVVLVPQIVVDHRFKPRSERDAFLSEMRVDMLHNSLRFGLLYASERSALQLLRYHALRFPDIYQTAMRAVNASDVWDRRAQLARELKRPFSWFVHHFDLKDQVGGDVLL